MLTPFTVWNKPECQFSFNRGYSHCRESLKIIVTSRHIKLLVTTIGKVVKLVTVIWFRCKSGKR